MASQTHAIFLEKPIARLYAIEMAGVQSFEWVRVSWSSRGIL
jgi:hypothetical protein